MSNNINNNILTFENYLVDQIPEAENFQPSSIPEKTKIITNLQQRNNVGWDNIPTTILKYNINILTPILFNLINQSLQWGSSPGPTERAKILPIFKNKDTLDITNYGPTSILPVISKVYEKGFYNRLYNYYSVNNLLSSSQFGFRSGAGTEHALLNFSDDILKLIDKKKVAIATFMDLSKAFDCVDHNILLSKVKRYGIHETALQWINSYQSDREDFVYWNQTHSTSLNPNKDVPQGSILGPLLLLIYINDTINSTNILSFVLFAS